MACGLTPASTAPPQIELGIFPGCIYISGSPKAD